LKVCAKQQFAAAHCTVYWTDENSRLVGTRNMWYSQAHNEKNVTIFKSWLRINNACVTIYWQL